VHFPHYLWHRIQDCIIGVDDHVDALTERAQFPIGD
jgi:hypothetical protein